MPARPRSARLPTARGYCAGTRRTSPPSRRHRCWPSPIRSRSLPERGGRAATRQKRNLGLLVARMLGWRSVLFLDDDIRGLDASDVCFAAPGLHSGAAVGFAVEHWSDHSVVSRAHQLSSASANSLVGGAALLIDPMSPLLGHFPAIHNADRLFLYDALMQRKVQHAPNTVERVPYDPLTDLRRAGAEEFGEVIGTGLVAYARHRGRSLVPLYEAYWREFLANRRDFIADILRRLDAEPPSPRGLTARRARVGCPATARDHHIRDLRAVLPALAQGAADLAGAAGAAPTGRQRRRGAPHTRPRTRPADPGAPAPHRW